MRGRTLAQAQLALPGQRFEAREIADLLAVVADALQHAHLKGIVHRDVKLSNILLDESGAPLLTDFGLALHTSDETTMLTAEGEVLGTPAYMSPEQARGRSHQVDGRSDVYSMGAVLYRMATNKPPFHGTPTMVIQQLLHDDPPPPRRLNDRMPRDLETICLKCLEKEPAKRYDGAAALAADLRRFRQGLPILGRPIARTERGWRWCRRNPLLAAAAALAATPLLAVAAVSAGWARHASRNASDLRVALHDSRLRLAENFLDRGAADAERGDVALGLLWMARGLQAVPGENAHLAGALRANLAHWGAKQPRLSACFRSDEEILALGADG